MTEFPSKAIQATGLTIGQTAMLQTWQEIRLDARRRMLFTATLGFLYVIASLLVGAYLLHALDRIVDDVPDPSRSWLSSETIELAWLSSVALAYLVATVIVGAALAFVILMLVGRLPKFLSPIAARTPVFGAICRIMSAGEFCQSLYRSVVQQKTYADAFGEAADEIREASIRHWAKHSSTRIAQGELVQNVLESTPIDDQPLAVISAVIPSLKNTGDSVYLWHEASAECHAVLQTRLKRGLKFVSLWSLLISVSLAGSPFVLATLFISFHLRANYFLYLLV